MHIIIHQYIHHIIINQIKVKHDKQGHLETDNIT